MMLAAEVTGVKVRTLSRRIQVNIKEQSYFGDLAKALLDYLNRSGYQVSSMLNLDTGMYDILRVYRGNGVEVP